MVLAGGLPVGDQQVRSALEHLGREAAAEMRTPTPDQTLRKPRGVRRQAQMQHQTAAYEGVRQGTLLVGGDDHERRNALGGDRLGASLGVEATGTEGLQRRHCPKRADELGLGEPSNGIEVPEQVAGFGAGIDHVGDKGSP